ncbi:MAG: ATP-binding protein [Verrucomicrobiales bacterium]
MKFKSRYRLLLIEDDDEQAESILSNLHDGGRVGFSVTRVKTEEEGLRLKGDQEFDAILLDLGLSGRDPRKTLRQYTECYREVPIVVLTSSIDEKLLRQAISWGAQDLLEKAEVRGGVIARSIRYSVERKRALLQLEQKNQDLKGFAHTVAHELKTPLQSIVTALGIAKETSSEQLPDNVRQLLSMGFESSNHLSNLINDLLAFAESDPGSETTGKVDLDSLARSAIAELQVADGADGARFEIVGPLPEVKGVHSRLRQVMRNLIANAIKYRREEPLVVEISSECRKGECTIRVKDNGLGIAPENLERIFESFYRVHSRDEIPGTGIGLGFAREVVERHGGTLGVESEEGVGSTFYFTLPTT